MSNRYCIIFALVTAASSPAVATAPPVSAPAKAVPATASKPTTRAQFVATIQARFNAIDANHDGAIDPAELAAAQLKQVEQARLLQERRLDAEFTRLDTNRDGQLSKAEFMAAAPPVQPRTTAQQIVAKVDSNKDGKISLQEYEARPLAAFADFDTNHDGTVSAAEIQAARAAMKR
jgi:Ca2+-binding EF-hand superfamily protein